MPSFLNRNRFTGKSRYNLNKLARWGAEGGPTSLSFQREREPTAAHPLSSPAPRSPCQAGRVKNNGSTFERNEGEDAEDFPRSAEKVLSARDPARAAGARRSLRQTLRGGATPAAAVLGPRPGRQCLHLSRGRGEKEDAGAEPKLLLGGREGGTGAHRGQVGADGQGGPRRPAGHGGLGAAEPGTPSAVARRRALPAALRSGGAGQSPRGRPPGPGPPRAGAPGRGDRPGRPLRPPPHSPGSSRAAAMGMARRPGEELAPRGRTGSSDAGPARAEGRLLPALSAPRRHGRPPGVSARPRDPHPATLRPLPPPPPPPPPPRRPPPTPHTLPSCSGEPLLSDVTSGRRWLGRGRARVGAGVGEDAPGERVSQNSGSCAGAGAGAGAGSGARHFGCGRAVLTGVAAVWAERVRGPGRPSSARRAAPRSRLE
ncbi:collagen alpha-1(I) chain-like [Meriones unguiculatus]|uniref:collagen alpha-1(I) chain-like n=1 Tax=Meriones unguiculatus TaxID=10047 RepID=UPI00293F6A17|nr:collagen alpha-1(I) chain-like [Meriones unguiculatus]